MKYTTTSILNQLSAEKEENSLVSKELLLKTITWIDLFMTYPEIEFDLSGDPTTFLPFLDKNKETIQETIGNFFDFATEEEAGVLEGYQVIESDSGDTIESSLPEVSDQKPPTLTLDYNELMNMFTHMKGIVDEHTKKISLLQTELESSKTTKPPRVIEAPAPPVTEAMHFITEQTYAPELLTTPPQLPSSYPQEPANYNCDDEQSAEPVHETYQEEAESVSDDFDTFSTAPVQSPAPKAIKPKLTKNKKIAITAVMLIILAGLLTSILIPMKRTSKTVQTQMQPPASINTPVIVPAMQNISAAKKSPPPHTAAPAPAQAPVQTTTTPAPQPVKETPLSTTAPTGKTPSKAKSETTTKTDSGPYVKDMKIYIKSDNNNIIRLGKDEKVVEIEGQDTDNWIFNYKPERHAIIFYANKNQLKNAIIIKTNKGTYTLYLTSSPNGYTQIDLTNK